MCRPLLRHPEVRAAPAASLEGRRPGPFIPGFAPRSHLRMTELSRECTDKFVGRSVPRLEDRPLLTGPGPLRRRYFVSRPVDDARGALGRRARQDRIDRRDGRARAARRARGVDRSRRRAHSADPVPAHRHSRRSSPTGSRCWRRTSCAMSASRSPSSLRTTPYLAEDAADLVELDIEQLRATLLATEQPGVYELTALSTEPRRHPQRAMATSTPPSAPRMPLSRLSFRSAAIPACRWKRAAPSRATTKRATFWKCTAPPRCRTGTAITLAQMLGRRRDIRPALRGPCRRRLRHSRRNLSRGRAGLRRRAEIPPSDQMDRGPARAPDRGQSLAPAAAPRARRHRRARATSSPSTTNFSTTTAPICAPTPPRCPISPPPCCRGPIACRPIAPSATSASPTRRRAAPIARPAATNPPSCASGCSMRSRPRSASTRSKSAAAI